MDVWVPKVKGPCEKKCKWTQIVIENRYVKGNTRWNRNKITIRSIGFRY